MSGKVALALMIVLFDNSRLSNTYGILAHFFAK